MHLKNAVLYLFILFAIPVHVRGQLRVIDSLKQALDKGTSTQRPLVMAELARANFEKDIALALRLGEEAIQLAVKDKQPGTMAFCYATLGHLLVQKNQQRRAAAYIDSAVAMANRAQEPELASFAYFRKGWLELVNGNDEKAMSWLLKADQLVEHKTSSRARSNQTLINHYLASIYAYGNDTLKQHRYAARCFAAARQSKAADDQVMGYMTIAHSFFSAFERDTTKRELLKRSLSHYQEAILIYQHNRERILIQSNGSVIALNIANSYFKYFPSHYRDSANQYVNLALTIARKSNAREVMANCYGILSEYALRDKKFDQAMHYLQTGISDLGGIMDGADITRARLMLALANVAEQSGDKSKALAYYKQYSAYYAKVFDAQKLTITQQVEAEFHAQQKESEIKLLKQKAAFNNRQNWLYVAIGSAGILALVLLLAFYHYRLKASQQQKQLSEQEREEAKLQALLKDAEARQLTMEKQEAELQASLQQEESEKLQAQQKLLQDRTDWLEKELMAGTLKIEEKNAILALLKQKAKDSGVPLVFKQMDRMINENLRLEKNFDEQQNLSQIHPGFLNALQQKAGGSLTQLDQKYCAYILMGLDTKDIANRLGIEPKSIRMARYRIKQKLKLGKDEQLDQAIRIFEMGTTGQNSG